MAENVDVIEGFAQIRKETIAIEQAPRESMAFETSTYDSFSVSDSFGSSSFLMMEFVDEQSSNCIDTCSSDGCG
jgi:hypothetical protein